MIVDDSRLTAEEFEKVKIAETIESGVRSLAAPCTARCGRPTRTRSAAWPRLSSLGATCRAGLTMPFATRSTNWLAIPRKAMPWARWPHAPTGSLG